MPQSLLENGATAVIAVGPDVADTAQWIGIGISVLVIVVSVVWSAAKIKTASVLLAVEVANLSEALGGLKEWLKEVDGRVDRVNTRLARLEGQHEKRCRDCGDESQ